MFSGLRCCTFIATSFLVSLVKPLQTAPNAPFPITSLGWYLFSGLLCDIRLCRWDLMMSDLVWTFSLGFSWLWGFCKGRTSSFGFLYWAVSVLSSDAHLFFPLAASISLSSGLREGFVVQREDLLTWSNSLPLGHGDGLAVQMEDLSSCSNSLDLVLAERLAVQMEDLSCSNSLHLELSEGLAVQTEDSLHSWDLLAMLSNENGVNFQRYIAKSKC